MMSQSSPSESSKSSSSLTGSLTTALKDRMFYVNVATENDMQSCNGPDLKRTFPDLDYALLAYDILKGYPLAVGHDPGFTFPVFTANYSEGKHTSDCRYLLPHGFVLIPDVACVTSFSSKIVQTRLELSHSLSTTVTTHGGGWGARFSASAGYKEAASLIATGENVFIRSTATCRFYYNKINEINPPALSPSFMKWVRKLNNADPNNETEFFNFFEFFGTRYVSGAVFGAKFIYEHRMESSRFETMKSSGVNVAASASYSGVVSTGGSFNLNSEQKEAANNFKKHVQTKTITIGAPPPANGDALTWASNVKNTPVPIKYELSSIENLFSSTYIKDTTTNYIKIANAIKNHKNAYCNYLRESALTDSCEEVKSQGIALQNTGLTRRTISGQHSGLRPGFKAFSTDRLSCIMECLERDTCIAVDYCSGCSSRSVYYMQCYMYSDSEISNVRGINKTQFETLILPTKIKGYLKLHDTSIIGTYEQLANQMAASFVQCMRWCFEITECAAFSFCKCPSGTDVQSCRCFGKTVNCKLFAIDKISMLTEERYTDAYFLSNHVTSANQTLKS